MDEVVLEKHKDLLNSKIDENVLDLIRQMFYYEMDLTILDSALEFILLYAKKFKLDNDLESLKKFVLNEQVWKKDYIGEILDIINNLLRSSTDVVIFKKIKIVLYIIMDSFSFSDEYKIIKDILDSNMHYSSYDFLLLLIQRNILNNDKVRLVINVALNSKIDYQRSSEELDCLLFILNNELVNELDISDYEKVVRICFDNAKWYLIYKLLGSDLPLNYKKIALAYYLKISNFSQNKIFTFNFSELELAFHIDIFMVVYNLELRKLDSDSYKSVLDEILNSDNIFLSAALKNHNVSSSKEKIALNRGNSKYIELASISAVLGKLNLVDFEEAINIIVLLVSKLEASKDEREKELLRAKLDCLIGIYNQEKYADDIFRLGYIINIILNANNLFQVNELAGFVTHPNAFYYSDLEFKSAIGILNDYRDIYMVHRLYASKYFLYARLLTNENVPFMDKSTLVSLALEENYQNLELLIRELNKLGRQNKNMMYVLGDNYKAPEMNLKKIRELIL